MNNNFFITDNGKKVEDGKTRTPFPFDGERELISICKGLTVDSRKYDASISIRKMSRYLEHYQRFLYSVVSKYIFNLSDEKVGLFTTNLDALHEYVRQQHASIDDNLKWGIVKFWDHVHLALYQCDNLRQGEDEFELRFKENVPLIKKDMEDDLTDFKSSMITQLIALVGIFTAMAFLVFGGINSLDNIFNGAKNFPIVVICIIGALWGMVMVNLVFVFMAFVAKLSNKPLMAKHTDGVNVIRMVKLLNVAMGFVLCFSVWIYILQYLGAATMAQALYDAYPMRTILISAGIIILSFAGVLLKIFLKHRDDET